MPKKKSPVTVRDLRVKAKEAAEMALRVASIDTEASVAYTLTAMELVITAALVEHGVLTMEEAMAPVKDKE